VRLNETFPAKFQHLYTSLTWRFFGWSGAREKLSLVSFPPSSFGPHPSLAWSSRDIVCCEPSAFIFRPSSFLGAAVRRAGMEPAVCGMFRDHDPSRSGGRGSPAPSVSSICAKMAAFERGLWPGVVGCVGTRTTYEHFSFFHRAITLALVTFAVEKMIVGPKQVEVAVATVPPAVAHRSGRRARRPQCMS
jgi:hypothetical protein